MDEEIEAVKLETPIFEVENPEDIENIEIEDKNTMLPSLFQECRPISTTSDLETVLLDPPSWINRILPLEPPSETVIQNTLSDCHSDSNHYLPRLRFDRRLVPKTLVCHDYKGGYQDDRFLHYPNEEILGNGYTFYNWAQIDIFVYFSHHFITIPPLCWINTAHLNGVKILGTLITEFDPGRDICKNLFKTQQTMRTFAKNLVKITTVFNIDGWLLNIENVIDEEIRPVFKEFVPYFTQLLHQQNPENLVIWYDSVTEKGALQWQNQLNKENQFYFNCCDGIFLNYVWTEKHLLNTVEVAKHRNFDVFVGIDVFGRNTFGGGMFNCYKAAEMIRRYNLSMAIFAPGWTHETLKQDNAKFFEEFLNRDSAFWSSLWPYMYTHPITHYFDTKFYIGLDKEYYNLFNQQKQLSQIHHPNNPNIIPNYQKIPTLQNKCNCIQGAVIKSKNTCLLTRHALNKDLSFVHHLFACDLDISNNTLVYFLTKSLSTQDNNAKVSGVLLVVNESGSFRRIKLLSKGKDIPVNNTTELEVNPSLDEYVLNKIKGRFDGDWDLSQMNLSVYTFTTPPSKILEIGAIIDDGDSIYLCAFGVKDCITFCN